MKNLTEQYWAMEPGALDRLLAYDGPPLPRPERPRAPARQISIIPILGAIERRTSVLTELVGGTSVDAVRGELAEALGRDSVSRIILYVDSPGGGASGLHELAADIREARRHKPVLAFVDGYAASAAYWLAAQASSVWATPSSQVGSIGVYRVHIDESGALAREGYVATVFASSPEKVEGHSLVPLTDEATEEMQGRIDVISRMFVRDVAEGMRTDISTVMADYGHGRVLFAPEALRVGMIAGLASSMPDMLAQVARVRRPA